MWRPSVFKSLGQPDRWNRPTGGWSVVNLHCWGMSSLSLPPSLRQTASLLSRLDLTSHNALLRELDRGLSWESESAWQLARAAWWDGSPWQRCRPPNLDCESGESLRAVCVSVCVVGYFWTEAAESRSLSPIFCFMLNFVDLEMFDVRVEILKAAFSFQSDYWSQDGSISDQLMIFKTETGLTGLGSTDVTCDMWPDSHTQTFVKKHSEQHFMDQTSLMNKVSFWMSPADCVCAAAGVYHVTTATKHKRVSSLLLAQLIGKDFSPWSNLKIQHVDKC